MSTGDHSRGLVTVVFADVEGSTALMDQVGDDAGVAAVDRQLETVRERVEPYGGRETKSLGDGLLLTFASPRAAVSFALACQRALAGTAPRVRIGINTGEVLTAASDPMGGAVNAAARIADRAAGGEVLVSAVVRQLVGSAPATRFIDRGRWRLKGFSERWHLYEAAEGAFVPEGSPTVGRVDAVAALDSLLSRTVEGAGGGVILEGEAGIGKTHLVRLAIDAARAKGLHVIEARADELERRPGAIAHGMLHSGEDERRARSRLGEQLTSQLDDEGSDRGFAVCEACVDLVEGVARPGGVLLVAEDLQWADDLSLRVVASIARRAGPSPVALIATCRPAPRPAMLDRILERFVAGEGQVIRLDPLAEIDVATLASAQLGAAAGPELRTRLAAAAGNPLFVEELLQAFEDDGALRVDAGVAELTTTALPVDLRSTLVRRLSWLDEDVIELLRLASILGGSFTLHDLAAITGRTVMDVAARLNVASQAGLVVGHGDRLAFRHDLIREAIYENMPAAVRQDLHRAAADALAASGAPVGQVARQVALGARTGDLEAVAWLERAGAESSSVDPASAIEFFDRALGLAPPDWPGRPALRVRLLEPYAHCGRFDDGVAVAESVLAGSPDALTEYSAQRGLAAILGKLGNVTAAISALHAAADAPGAPPGAAQELRLVAAQMTLTSGAATPADREAITLALTDAEAGHDARLTCLAHQVLGFVAAVEGRDGDAYRSFHASLALLEAGRAPWTNYLSPDGLMASTLLTLDRLDEAAVAADAARRRAERQSALADLPFMHLVIGAIPMYAGRYDDAVAHFQAGVTIVDDSRAANFVLYLEAGLARIATRCGDLDGAASVLASGFARLGAGTAPFGADWLLDAQAELLTAHGQDDAALSLLEAIWVQMEPVRFFFGFRALATHLVVLANRLGRTDLALDGLTALEESTRRTPAPSTLAAARRCRGIVDRDPDVLLEAVALHRATPLRPELASCCEDAATLLSELGRTDDALALLDEAAAIHAGCGADGELARVDAAIEQLGRARPVTRPRRPAFGWDTLTPSELHVVELVSEGLTNPEIGSRLNISRRTVESHLSHVFTKVGLATRTQVAAHHVRRSGSRSTGAPKSSNVLS